MKQAQIYYISLPDEWRKEQKLQWFAGNSLGKIAFEKITPDEKGNWINQADNPEWEDFLPVCSKEVGINAIFAFSSLGVSTNRDEWVYDFDKENLQQKMRFFIDKYNDLLQKQDFSWEDTIKWSRDLKRKFERNQSFVFEEEKILTLSYRPFVKANWYSEKAVNDILTQNHYDIFGEKLNSENQAISINKNSKDLRFLASKYLSDLHFLGDNQCLPLYRYDKDGSRKDNITDWALEQFQTHYKDTALTKTDIFHYIYAVLHHPTYRQKYELNLKRDFPRIPFYADFHKWKDWGRQLMDLHIGYETVAPFPLTRKEVQPKQAKKKAENLLSDLEPPKALFEEQGEYTFVPKTRLKADKEKGHIEIDDLTTLTGIPPQAWDYKLGNRSALEWILDQYKESKPSAPTILAKFNTYRFADYKESVIDLLMRVCTVSVETQRIVGEMG